MSKISASKDVLDTISKHKRAIRNEIAVSQEFISDTFQAIVSPATQISGKGHQVSQIISRGMAIFEGVRIGLRLVRSIRSLFGQRKRR